MNKKISIILVGSLLTTACIPRIEIAASEKPITINLNVKVEHEIRITVNRDVEQLLKEHSDLF